MGPRWGKNEYTSQTAAQGEVINNLHSRSAVGKLLYNEIITYFDHIRGGDMSAKMKGKVKWYNRSRGFGVIVADNGKEYFLHHSCLPPKLSKVIEKGSRLRFEIIPRPYHRGYEAINVEIDNSPVPEPLNITNNNATSDNVTAHNIASPPPQPTSFQPTARTSGTDYWFKIYASESSETTEITETEKKLTATAKDTPIMTKVVGVTYEGRQSIIAHLHIGEKVQLVREPNNLYDQNAIKVVRTNGQCIGFINKSLAAHLAPQLDKLENTLEATVTSITGGHYPGSNLGVKIKFYLPGETNKASNSDNAMTLNARQMSALAAAAIAARAGMKHFASHIIRNAFTSKEAQEKHIATLPKMEEGFRFAAVFTSDGISLCAEYPKSQRVRPIDTFEVFDVAWAAKALADDEIEVSQTSRGRLQVKPTSEHTEVKSWTVTDPYQGVVKQVKKTDTGFLHTTSKNRHVAQKVYWAHEFAQGNKYGVTLYGGSRQANFIDSLYSSEVNKADYWAKAGERGYHAAAHGAGDDTEKGKEAMHRYRIAFEDGKVAEKSLLPEQAERLKKYATVTLIEE